MREFSYHRPKSVADAVKTFSGKSEARYLAGGHSLLPAMKQRLNAPSDLIDLSGIKDLKGIKVSGGEVVIGAGTTHAEVAHSAEIMKAIPALCVLADGIGDPQVRNRGTIGGSLANNDPASDYPAAVLGLGATVVTNKREIAADKFFKGLFETALEDGEVITSVRFPVPEKAGYAKFAQPASRFCIVGVMAAKTKNGVRVAVTGAGPGVFRASDLEKALSSGFSASAQLPAASAKGLNSDIHAGAEYRAHLIGVMAKRAVAAAG
ncbi:MAG: xanthine dehydrogenase family protein subunit M [Alphaproteobacteria bacterium]|nr:xanthine dehydrogenase family protein subunit M [Alphaproteobacteria bacterium]